MISKWYLHLFDLYTWNSGIALHAVLSYMFLSLLMKHLQENHQAQRASKTLYLFLLFAMLVPVNFVVLPCCSLEICIQSPCLLPLACSLVAFLCSAIVKVSSESHLRFFSSFLYGMYSNCCFNDGQLNFLSQFIWHLLRSCPAVQTYFLLQLHRDFGDV